MTAGNGPDGYGQPPADPPGGYPPYPNYPPGGGQSYGQPSGPPYGQPGWAPAQQPGTNGLAIAALVLGILPIFGVGAMMAIVFGVIARGQIARSGQGGKGMAIAGIILGSLWIVVVVVIIIVVVTHHGSACVGSPGVCPPNHN
jgi:hypothetical protein